MKRICLFCSYSPQNTINYSVKIYLDELKKYFSKIIFLTNNREILAEDLNYLDANGFDLIYTKNEGYDFGMWQKYYTKMDFSIWDEIAFVNDSCFLYASLQPFFNWANKNNQLDFYGLSESGYKDKFLSDNHIQSYFLVFRKNCFNVLKKYFQLFGIKKDFKDVVKFYEIGLCQFLFSINLSGKGFYNLCDPLSSNKMLYEPISLIKKNFPLIKKKLLTHNSHYILRSKLLKKYGKSILDDYNMKSLKSFFKYLFILFISNFKLFLRGNK